VFIVSPALFIRTAAAVTAIEEVVHRVQRVVLDVHEIQSVVASQSDVDTVFFI
jgi:hypothetical protein